MSELEKGRMNKQLKEYLVFEYQIIQLTIDRCFPTAFHGTLGARGLFINREGIVERVTIKAARGSCKLFFYFDQPDFFILKSVRVRRESM